MTKTNRDLGLGGALYLLLLSAPLQAQGGLPPVPVPPQNPITAEKAVLGKILFWDEQLSSNNRVACGTCHQPALGGGDPRRLPHPGPDGLPRTRDDTFGSPGIPRADAQNDYQPDPRFGFADQVTPRATPTYVAVQYFPELFWDGRARSQFVDPETGQVSIPAGGALESQVVGPLLNDVEMAHQNRDWNQITGKLAQSQPLALASSWPADVTAAIAANPTYPALFQAAFMDSTITAERIAYAIATYERTLVPDQAPWDLFMRGNPGAMTQNQVAGWNLFRGAARCDRCHTPGLFSDRQFRNLGLRRVQDDIGRQQVTGQFADRGKFKVATLRNVGLKRTFMHTGQFTSIQQVIGFYRNGGGPNRDNQDPLLRRLNLNPQQSNQLADFVINGLTDPRVRNQQFPFDRPTLYGERNPPGGNLFGSGTPGSGGAVPRLLAEAPANVGFADFKLGVGDALGGAASFIGLSLGRSGPGAVIQGVPVLIDVSQAEFVFAPLSGSGAGNGYGTWHRPVPAVPSLAGLSLFAQWFAVDAGALPGVSRSRGAAIRIL